MIALVAIAGVSSSAFISNAGAANAADAPSVLFVRGADRSGGFLEANNDAARTEQLADINNASTNGGNHGWATFAGVLRDVGFDVDQVTEGAEQGGPTNGLPVDFVELDLDRYDLIVFGSNNAVYTAAQVDAVDSYVRDGGAALFISDANFGGSWQDAPNSDQQFLDRYGVTVYQDTGTYGVDADEFITPGHPVLDGVSSFDGEGVSPFDVGNATVDVTVLAQAEGNVRLNPGDRQGPSRQADQDDAAAWVADVGAGRIAGHYDRNTFFNANGAGTNIGRFSNEQYAVNLFSWLTENSSQPTLTPGGAGVSERNNGQTDIVRVPLTLSAPADVDVAVDFETLAPSGAGLAIPGEDFVAASGQVIIPAGQTTGFVEIQVLGDNQAEDPLFWGEWILVRVTSNDAVVDQSFFGLGVGVIIDND